MSKIVRIICMSCLPIVACFILYLLNFGSNRFSTDHEDWAHFSDFMSVSINLSSFALLIFVAYWANQELIENQRFRKKPILLFKKNEKALWTVKNFGNGPAIDILISFSNGSHNWDMPAKIYSLMSGEELVLDWIPAAKELLAQYHGIDDVRLQSYCVRHSTQLITDEDKFHSLDVSVYRSWEEIYPRLKNQ